MDRQIFSQPISSIFLKIVRSASRRRRLVGAIHYGPATPPPRSCNFFVYALSPVRRRNFPGTLSQ